MDALDNKCPACGAKIDFNPKNQMWDCNYCGSKFTLEEMKKHENASTEEANSKKETKKIENAMTDVDVYHCKNCGAEVMADETTTATFCVYCGSTTILKEKIDAGVAPSKIIPFKKVKDDAVTAFKGLYKGRPLMPKLFNDINNIEKITGVYIPFWQYDLNSKGKITFNSTDVKTWSDYNYRYVKTDRYLSIRDCDLEFNGILVDGSSRFDDDLMDSLEPFEFNDLVEYNHAYLSGFLAEKYDVDSEKAMERASYRAMNSTVDIATESVIHQTRTVATNDVKVTKIKDEFIMLPVWMLNINYKDKKYTFAMNGQTGEIVGNIPIDIKKAVLISIILFVIIAVIAFLIMFLGGNM